MPATRCLLLSGLLLAVCAVQVAAWGVGAQDMQLRGSGRQLLGAAEEARERLGGQANSLKNQLPRLNYKFQSVPEEFDMENEEYRQSIIMVALLFGIIPAGIYFVLGIFIYVCKFVFGTCGGKKVSEDGYTKTDRRCLKAVLFICSLVVIVGVIVGYVGNSSLDASIVAEGSETKSAGLVATVSSGVDATASEVETAVEQLEATTSTLSVTLQDAAESDASDKLNNLLKKIRTESKDARELSLRFEGYRLAVINICLIYALLVVAVAATAGTYLKGWLAFIGSILAHFATVLMLVLFGLHLAASVLAADFCLEMNTYLEAPSAGNSAVGGLSFYLSCVGNSTASPGIAVSQYALFNGYTSLNDASDLQLDGSSIIFPTATACFCPCDASGSFGITAQCNACSPRACENMLSQNGDEVDLTIEQGLAMLNMSDEAVARNVAQVAAANTSLASWQDFDSCGPVTDVVTDLSTVLCTDAINSINLISISSLLLAIIMIPMNIALLYGRVRFNMSNDSETKKGKATIQMNNRKRKQESRNRAKDYATDRGKRSRGKKTVKLGGRA
eukprot:PLAT9905.1.p1 GENE.PLAT9905.1~~PLAT9905.1.p1  ORF type:complete len:569 (+),score=275.26 PLAT9905.1:25-1707(+)